MKILNFNKFLNKNTSFVFITVNITVAFIGFVRSFAFMKLFNFNELGLITIINTGAMLIGFFQFGLINGGYRIIALKKEDSSQKTNNVIYSYFGILFYFFIIVYIIGVLSGIILEKAYVLISIFIGLFNLVVNWLTNTLIGNKEYKRLNRASLIAAIIGLVSLGLAFYFGIYGAVLSLFLQPLLFVLIVFLSGNEFPKKIDLDINYIKYILGFGFIPFLSGMFLLIYMQIERWSINFYLGSEALGKMYLVFIITALWSLIPTSINSLFFPDAVKLYVNNNFIGLSKMIRRYYIILIGYSFTISTLVILLLHLFVGWFFPNHLPDVYLAIMVLPALIFRTMSDPIILLLNSMVILKPIFWGDLICILIYITLVLILGIMKIISLENMLLCLTVYYLCRFVYLFFVYLSAKKKLVNF
jgi:O-antigen/teichoic acid export membrane protein